ncbi:hypothetical protein J3F83DRAFT_148672 [Trichoderma novae-zelandiae]
MASTPTSKWPQHQTSRLRHGVHGHMGRSQIENQASGEPSPRFQCRERIFFHCYKSLQTSSSCCNRLQGGPRNADDAKYSSASLPSVPADTQCSNLPHPIGKAALTHIPSCSASTRPVPARPRTRPREPRWRRGPSLVLETLQPSWFAREGHFDPWSVCRTPGEEGTFRPCFPVAQNCPIMSHYCRKFLISHPHTVTAPKRGLWRVEPPGRRAGKAARDLASKPCKIAARFAPNSTSSPC